MRGAWLPTSQRRAVLWHLAKARPAIFSSSTNGRLFLAHLSFDALLFSLYDRYHATECAVVNDMPMIQTACLVYGLRPECDPGSA
jgi:hypothetical protein